MSFNLPFYGAGRVGFFTGSSASSPLVPGAYHLALDGIPFILDQNPEDLYRIPRINGPSSIPANSAQQDQGSSPGEQSLNREDVWRKAFSSWDHGTGQTWFDRSDSDQFRFRTSKGVDPWTRWQLDLLPDTSSKATASTAFTVAAAVSDTTGGSTPGFYVMDGTTVRSFSIDTSDVFTDNGTVTGFSGTAGGFATTIDTSDDNQALTSDGTYCYVLDTGGGTNMLVQRVVNGSVFDTWATTTGGVLRGIRFVKGRLLTWGDTSTAAALWDVTATGTKASPSVTFTGLPDVQDVAGGTANVYVLLRYHSGTAAEIQKLDVDPSAGTLTNQALAATLPVGETPYTIFGYSGFVCIGTDMGFRIAQENSDGTLTVGALVNIGVKVRAFSAVGQYVYFAWSNYDGSSTGLGRINLSVFTSSDALVPAYASDIMATAQGEVTCILAFDNNLDNQAGSHIFKPYFLTTTHLYNQTSSLVSSGTLNTGFASWGIADFKTAVGLIASAEPLNGTIGFAITNAKGGTSAVIDTLNVAGATSNQFTIRNVAGTEFELTFTLTPSGSTSPVLVQATLLARPAPASGEYWTIPVIMAEKVLCLDGKERPMDIQATLRRLRAIRSPSKTPVVLQIAGFTTTVFLDDYQNHPHHLSLNKGSYSATCVLSLKDLTGVTV